MIAGGGRSSIRRLPILTGLTATIACLLTIGIVVANDTGQSLMSVLRLSPDSSPGSVPNPYCRSKPTGDLPPPDVSGMRLWNYDASWHASEWDNSFILIFLI